ncbi:MAG: NAD(P)H-dependent oxidoreductase [Deltaproteobacteria bacterium]|nr:NAD(P)H-dependent oxidoreductase [Deltaproteobacteria bacterium]MCB2186327.1 NAD(P)H-dependent oxidoreductase [Deltaproteobacteria bacterium]
MTPTVQVILAHPRPGSFNHAIAGAVMETLAELGRPAVLHDLYQEGFDPLLPAAEIPQDGPLPPWLAAHTAEVTAAPALVMVHPNWWGMPPAILKGWVDRVLRAGAAYEFLEGDMGEGVPRGLLAAHTALVFNTSNTPADRELAIFGDPLETIWKNCIFGLCGQVRFGRRTFGMICTSTSAQRRGWLAEARQVVREYLG